MKIIKQMLWIFFFSSLGEVLAVAMRSIVAIPGSVMGMMLLFLALHFNILKMEQVETVGTWLTDNMSIFFVPAGVGLMTNFSVLSESWMPLLIVMIVTCGGMMLFVGKIVQSLKLHSDKKKIENVFSEEEVTADD